MSRRAARPNVLWLMTDEQRTDSLGCYGSAWARTPTLDRLAAEGVRFETALTPAPICAPARSAILTGRHPSETGIWSNDQAEGVAGVQSDAAIRPAPPLTGAFAAAGYRTASFGKHHHLTDPPRAFQTQRHDVHEHLAARERWEADLWLSSEVDYCGYAERWDQADFDVVQYPPEPFPWILAGRFPGDPSETAEARVVAEAEAWLGEVAGAPDPFFLRLSFNGPHTPVAPPAPWDTCVDPREIVLPGPTEVPAGSPPWLHDYAAIASSARLSASELDRARQAYYGEVAFLDSLIGGLLDRMDARGLLENLVIVFCSDHGNHLGDFGLLQKQTFFDPAVNVPYLFWAPGLIGSPRVVRTPVGLIGLLPTLLDLLGLEVPRGLGGLSLAATLTGGVEPPARPVFSEFMPLAEVRRADRLVLVRDGAWKLSARLGPELDELLLVDLGRDPEERVNLADDPAARPERDRLARLIAEHVAAPPASP
ncbi:MAG: sulfatase-like hydrolase/transferase [Actinobacteria bacterium]|nr:sulfatase-like hydrolase/transferase [Actinomycetota bacterium]